MDQVDYTTMDLSALKKAGKKIKQNTIITAVFIGFNVGVMLYGYVTKGFGWVYTIIPVVLISASVKYQQVQNIEADKIKAEMLKRNAAG